MIYSFIFEWIYIFNNKSIDFTRNALKTKRLDCGYGFLNYAKSLSLISVLSTLMLASKFQFYNLFDVILPPPILFYFSNLYENQYLLLLILVPAQLNSIIYLLNPISKILNLLHFGYFVIVENDILYHYQLFLLRNLYLIDICWLVAHKNINIWLIV